MYIQLNGQILYYEKSGNGQPFLLVHGNGESHEIFDVLIPALSEHFEVYAIDSRGHGLSASPAELHYNDMADDIAAFIDGLSLYQPLFYGFSDGGIIGLLTAMKYPDKLSKLMISGANLDPHDIGSRIYHEIKKSQKTNPNIFQPLLLNEPHIDAKELEKISIPTLVLAGEKDIIKRRVTQTIADHIPHSTLVIVKDEDHGSYIEHSDKLFPLLSEFLNG